MTATSQVLHLKFNRREACVNCKGRRAWGFTVWSAKRVCQVPRKFGKGCSVAHPLCHSRGGIYVSLLSADTLRQFLLGEAGPEPFLFQRLGQAERLRLLVECIAFGGAGLPYSTSSNSSSVVHFITRSFSVIRFFIKVCFQGRFLKRKVN